MGEEVRKGGLERNVYLRMLENPRGNLLFYTFVCVIIQNTFIGFTLNRG